MGNRRLIIILFLTIFVIIIVFGLFERIPMMSNLSDRDGDGVSNEFEERFNANPDDFFSVPAHLVSRTMVFIVTILIGIILICLLGAFSLYEKELDNQALKFGIPISIKKEDRLSQWRKLKNLEFANYGDYEDARKIGAYTKTQLNLVLQTKAPNYDLALKIFEGGFQDLTMYEKALKIGANTKAQYDLVLQTKAPNYDLALKIFEGGFQDLTTYERALKIDAITYNNFKEAKKGSDKFKKESEFPNYESYLNALEIGVVHFFEYQLIQNYQVSSVHDANTLFLQEVKSILKKHERNKYIWPFSELQNRLNISKEKKLTIPEDKIIELLSKLLESQDIQGRIDNENHQFISSKVINTEIQKIHEYISKIRENIPISLIQIAEITGLPKSRIELVITDLASSNQPAGEYLPLEGVFIKNSISFKTKFDDNTCFYCGEIITLDSKVCPSCGKVVIDCQICKRNINFGDESGGCLYCGNDNFHYKHFAETIKITGKCPICKEPLTESEIIIKQSGKSKK